MKNIIIIGCGASGTTLAHNIIKYSEIPLNISIFEKGLRFTQGNAYSTNKDEHLLNVRVSNMSAISDEPNHFFDWTVENNLELTPLSFASRKEYGKYLEDLLNISLATKPNNIQVNLYSQEIIDIDFKDGKYIVYSDNKMKLNADYIFLAIGNFPPDNSFQSELNETHQNNYISNPWNWDDLDIFYSRNKNIESALIIGSGLSMVDSVLSLKKLYPKSKIISISRNGYRPISHITPGKYPDFSKEFNSDMNLEELIGIVNKHIKIAKNSNTNPLYVFDSLRQYTQNIFHNFSEKDKLTFLKRIKPMWDVVRHRIPPDCDEILEQLITNKELKILRGRIGNISKINNKLNVEYLKLPENDLINFETDIVVNCTGINSNYSKIKNILLKNLFSKGIITTDKLNLGLNTTIDGAIINSDNQISNQIFSLGSPLKGILWETIAIPEIRNQARNLAKMFQIKR